MSRRSPSAANPHGIPSQRLSTSRRPRARTTLAGRCPNAVPGPNGGAGFGVSPGARWNLRLYLHTRRRVVTDPREGVVYGFLGTRIGAAGPDGYERSGRRSPEDEQYIHRIIWESVHGPIPAGLQIDHRNGIRNDNRIANLRLATPQENVAYALRAGSMRRGESAPSAKLTDAIVGRIRKQAGRKKDAAWADELGVDRTTIRSARIGETWRHVKPRPRMQSKKRPRSR